MERALLQGEREAERALLQKEQKAAEQLQEKLAALETGVQKERDKVTAPGRVPCGHQRPGRGGGGPLGPLTLNCALQTGGPSSVEGIVGSGGRCGLGWRLGSPLAGSLCCLWVPVIGAF